MKSSSIIDIFREIIFILQSITDYSFFKYLLSLLNPTLTSNIFQQTWSIFNQYWKNKHVIIYLND